MAAIMPINGQAGKAARLALELARFEEWRQAEYANAARYAAYASDFMRNKVLDTPRPLLYLVHVGRKRNANDPGTD